jgi:hypothetical protein
MVSMLKAPPLWMEAPNRILLAACIFLSLISHACSSQDTHATSSPELEHYRRMLAISQVESYYYNEPETKMRYGLVRGTLTNLGNETYMVVEFTLKFKDSLNHTIFEDHAYPVFVSTYSQSSSQRLLGPGQKTRFAFKSLKCPENWQAGRVEIEITKVVPAQGS